MVASFSRPNAKKPTIKLFAVVILVLINFRAHIISKIFWRNADNFAIGVCKLENVRILSYSGLNVGNYGPEKLRISTLFTHLISYIRLHKGSSSSSNLLRHHKDVWK